MVSAAAAAPQMADQSAAPAQAKVDIPITEQSDGSHRKIPKAVFIEDVEAWIDKYGEDPLWS